MKILSEYHGDRSIRQSLVYTNGDGKYYVRQIEDGLVRYTTKFDVLDEAEDFAEDWIMYEGEE